MTTKCFGRPRQQRNDNQVFWTPQAAAKREEAIGSDNGLRQCFMATEQTLREAHYQPGTHSLDVIYTKYRLEVEVDRDRMLRITSIEIMDVTEK